MKKLSMIILVIFTTTNIGLCQVDQTSFFSKDLLFRELKGKVKIITESESKTDSCSLLSLEQWKQCIKCREGLNNSPKTELTRSRTFKFDQNRRFIEGWGVGMDVMNKIEFDNNGNIIEEVVGLKENGTYERKKTCHYNNLGLWTEFEEIDFELGYGHSRAFKAEYDDLGNLIEEKKYNNGSCEEITTFEYDVRNKLIEKKLFRNGNLIYTDTYNYDNWGNLLSKGTYYYHYNDDGGNLIESDVRYEVSETNKYNSNNKLIEKKLFHNGTLLSTVTYKYDVTNNIIEETIIEPLIPSRNDIVSVSSIKYKYDNRNKLIESSWCKRHHSGTTSCGKTTYKYDIIGNIIEEKSFVNGVLTAYESHKYDNRGNLIERNGNLRDVVTYKYDENDNWIESKTYNSLFKVLTVHERKIEYYTE